LAIFSGGDFELLFKLSGKGRVVSKAALETNIRNGGWGGV
jgi:hypothetical protein